MALKHAVSRRSIATDLERLLHEAPVDLVSVALTIARIESMHLDAAIPRAELSRLTAAAERRLADLAGEPVRTRIAALNRLIYREEGFAGNVDRYEDIRNSLLHLVVERRTGIPISLAVVYMAIARGTGLEIFGVSFPGHFLMRVPRDAGDDGSPIILDPFDGGRELSIDRLKVLLAAHAGNEVEWDDALLAPATPRQIAVRMLNNLKRLYVGMRSFDQAWQATDALVAIGGRDLEDVRDRGLLAYHVDDYPSALADLEEYMQAKPAGHEGSSDRQHIWEHLSALRKRVAAMN